MEEAEEDDGLRETMKLGKKSGTLAAYSENGAPNRTSKSLSSLRITA